jgi:hypothetical protein
LLTRLLTAALDGSGHVRTLRAREEVSGQIWTAVDMASLTRNESLAILPPRWVSLRTRRSPGHIAHMTDFLVMVSYTYANRRLQCTGSHKADQRLGEVAYHRRNGCDCRCRCVFYGRSYAEKCFNGNICHSRNWELHNLYCGSSHTLTHSTGDNAKTSTGQNVWLTRDSVVGRTLRMNTQSFAVIESLFFGMGLIFATVIMVVTLWL